MQVKTIEVEGIQYEVYEGVIQLKLQTTLEKWITVIKKLGAEGMPDELIKEAILGNCGLGVKYEIDKNNVITLSLNEEEPEFQ
jgi:hypothetical protein